MDALITPDIPLADPAIHLEVQQFYARQMHLLDAGQTEAWAHTFVEDGVFAVDDRVVSGIANIAEAAAITAEDFAARGIIRRHWLGMLAVTELPGGFRARSYALVLEVLPGGEVIPRRSTVCIDHLGRTDLGWKVVHRQVCRDGAPA